MSETASLPGYSTHPTAFEQRLSGARPTARPSSSFIKQSKTGGLTLRLSGQDDDGTLPVYGSGQRIEGAVKLAKLEGILSVIVKIEGVLKLKEIGEGGTVSHSLCLNEITIWSKERDGRYPEELPFGLELPTTFYDGKSHYPLPPTYGVRLSDVPGFYASIDFSVKAIAQKTKSSLSKTNLFGLVGLGNPTVSTFFVYYPRTRPALSLPSPLMCFPESNGFVALPEWTRWEDCIRAKKAPTADIVACLFLPRSRIFCLSEAIPFHVMFSSSAMSLAAFMPLGPSAGLAGKPITRIKLIRQSNCDVRNEIVNGVKTEIWRTDVIGEGTFQRAGDGASWVCFDGHIGINSDVQVGGFKAGGLLVRDYIVLTMTPPEPRKCPFKDLRIVVPVRLTTDPWAGDDSEYRYQPSLVSIPSEPEDYVELPQLNRT